MERIIVLWERWRFTRVARGALSAIWHGFSVTLCLVGWFDRYRPLRGRTPAVWTTRRPLSCKSEILLLHVSLAHLWNRSGLGKWYFRFGYKICWINERGVSIVRCLWLFDKICMVYLEWFNVCSFWIIGVEEAYYFQNCSCFQVYIHINLHKLVGYSIDRLKIL